MDNMTLEEEWLEVTMKKLFLILLLTALVFSVAAVHGDQIPMPNQWGSSDNSSAPSGIISKENYIDSITQGPTIQVGWTLHRWLVPLVPASRGYHENVGFGGGANSRIGSDMVGLAFGCGSTNDSSTSEVYINTTNEYIPINLCNAKSLSMELGNFRYVNGIPEVVNNFTAHDVQVGNGSVTITITQKIDADWTIMTFHRETYVDLSNLTLDLPIGTQYSLTFCWEMSLMKAHIEPNGYTETSNQTVIQPTEITRDLISYDINESAYQKVFACNCSLAGNFDDIQGLTRTSRPIETSFQEMEHAVNGQWGYYYCYQTFNNLTYGQTTAIKADPTINLNHDRLAANPFSNGANIPLVLLAIPIGVIVAVVLYKKKYKKKN
jgi:hypothetical protein